MKEMDVQKNKIEKANKVLMFRGLKDSIHGKQQNLSD